MHIGFLFTKHVLHFLYNACGKWYFQSKISPFGLIQAGHTKLENGVSLSMGIVGKIWNMFCDQGVNGHLWLNSRMFWFIRLTLVIIWLPISLRFYIGVSIYFFVKLFGAVTHVSRFSFFLAYSAGDPNRSFLFISKYDKTATT